MGSMTVVLVERDAALSRQIVAALRKRRCRPLVATDYASGLRLMRQNDSVAVLYLAEQLARRSGPDLLARLERERGLRPVPTVIRVSDDTGLMALALRRGGMLTVVASIGAESIASTIYLARLRDRSIRRRQAEVIASARATAAVSLDRRARSLSLREVTRTLAPDLAHGGTRIHGTAEKLQHQQQVNAVSPTAAAHAAQRPARGRRASGR